MKVLVLLVFMAGCADNYHVSETTICEKHKVVFKCEKSGTGWTTKALCDTKEECTRICLELEKEDR